MDFVKGLLKSNGFDTIFVMVDRLSNFAHFVTLKHLLIAKIVADVFIREVVPSMGFLYLLYLIVIEMKSLSIISGLNCFIPKVPRSELWFERNQRVFHEKQLQWSDCFEIARLNASAWCSHSKSFSNFSLQYV